ncbi:MAG: transcriptional repressor [Desulfomonilia bacterium]|nr:transcriptional repressor [Desulfomonilia bacterium]
MTRQKKVILEELKKVTSHPTAYELYERVKARVPQVSLGTVYRNLDQLSSRGIIRKIELGQGQRRFDATLAEHHHIRCLSCGRVDDIPLNPLLGMPTLQENISALCGYEVLGCVVDFQGICPECKKKRGSMEADRGSVFDTSETIS